MKSVAAVAAVLLLGVGVSWGQAVTGARPVTTLRLLEQRLPDVQFRDTPLQQVMEWLQDTMQLNIVVRWEALENADVPRDKPISLAVKNVRFSQVLWMILNEAGGSDTKLAYRLEGNVLTLSTLENLGQEMIVKTYDVGDLLVRVQRFQGPEIDLSQAAQSTSGGGGGGQSLFQDNNDNDDEDNDNEGGVTAEMQQLMNLIRTTIEPDSWVENGGLGTLSAYRNQLIVRNNIFVHQRLGGFIQGTGD